MLCRSIWYPEKTGKFRLFPVIFRGQISQCGIFWHAVIFITIDSIEFINNCKFLEEIYTPVGYRGEGVPFGGTDRSHP
jgi:hypothetical protein